MKTLWVSNVDTGDLHPQGTGQALPRQILSVFKMPSGASNLKFCQTLAGKSMFLSFVKTFTLALCSPGNDEF